MKKKKRQKLSLSDRLILNSGYILLGIFLLAIIVPLIYVIVASFMDPVVLSSEGITFDFSKWSLEGYKRVLKDDMLLRGFLNSVFYSVSYAVISVAVTLMAAYPLSKEEFVGRKFVNTLYVITMFLGGGLIPTYLLIDKLNLLNTVWAILLPGAINVWNIMLAKTYFKTLPRELREASAIDGASEIKHFFKIVLPVSKPIIAVLMLYQFVGQWNSYFDAMIYIDDTNLQPLQLVIRSILIQNAPSTGMIADIQGMAEMSKISELLKYSTIVVSSLPLLVMYPFFQKYFDKGIMVGSIKG
ncbi:MULTISPECIES: carbohydrate ABC transporter permease [unclassified Clostridium]|uniref:carbohydrate ABC transporter permease n=1 Tax=Clostridium TaxID=1485 RepID=UPI001C8C8172|nr:MULTISPECIES: carbohydrate ABC transporter permease [unclassified Clostridium]MBX9138101.1 carbohydrate ABC transporter permease [Clostridium sp. K12(2020)]MBX9142842.1 carbohydrate ABC transporter permease [Clostridium sp. K13]MDU2290917.1 carbohydrate ABC transporter permease [Clostridium celatum]MDU4326661.1 carbohydrate ABC transporter permease [Clostridium celatum]